MRSPSFFILKRKLISDKILSQRKKGVEGEIRNKEGNFNLQLKIKHLKKIKFKNKFKNLNF